MYKYNFFNDYSEGCHPKILENLIKYNTNQEPGYGEDSFSKKAKDLIRGCINNQNTDIHFISGGTQANLVCLSAILRPYESVISANSGHILVHEAGAIEATGHKINEVSTNDGKLSPQLVDQVLNLHTDEHMVKPKVVFISNATEIGTTYSKKELVELSEFCKLKDLILYLDGARIGSAIMSNNSDLSLADIATLTDIFYIGGTKNGALLGEAIVISNDQLKPNFRYNLKQNGALLAKGRIVGIQFATLFEGNLYFDLAKHANLMASKLSRGVADLGYNFLTESTTNQIFPILPNKIIQRLKELYGFYEWQKIDDLNTAIRLVTSWATEEKYVYTFLNDLKSGIDQ